jgi:hypothetical protein
LVQEALHSLFLFVAIRQDFAGSFPFTVSAGNSISRRRDCSSASCKRHITTKLRGNVTIRAVNAAALHRLYHGPYATPNVRIGRTVLVDEARGVEGKRPVARA